MSEWDKIVGHQWAVDVLRSAIQYGRVGHAYLITGPAWVGKGTLARTFAQALNCTAAETSGRPCGHCRSCTLIAAGRHPDVKIVTGETSDRGKVTLKIDQIRQLQSELNLTAAEARTKVAILENFERTSKGAANAFLKTLEEPPGDVVLILTANDANVFSPVAIAQRPVEDRASGMLWDESDIILPTIASRCRIINLRPLPAGLIETSLIERRDVEPDKARVLAHLSDGRMGWAVKMVEEPAALEERSLRLQALHETLGQSTVERFAAAEQLARQPEELTDLLQLWLGYWRDLALIASGADASIAVTNVDQLEKLTRYVQAWPVEAIVESLRRTERALWQLERNANTRLVVENLLLGYPRNQPPAS